MAKAKAFGLGHDNQRDGEVISKEDTLAKNTALATKIEMFIARGFTDVEACKKAGTTNQDYVRLRGENQDFQAGYQRAMDEQIQWYEMRARKRAVKGYIETTYGPDGKVKKSVKKFDNDLLVKLLGARDKRYRTAVKGNELNVTIDVAGKLEAARARVKKLKKVE